MELPYIRDNAPPISHRLSNKNPNARYIGFIGIFIYFSVIFYLKFHWFLSLFVILLIKFVLRIILLLSFFLLKVETQIMNLTVSPTSINAKCYEIPPKVTITVVLVCCVFFFIYFKIHSNFP